MSAPKILDLSYFDDLDSGPTIRERQEQARKRGQHPEGNILGALRNCVHFRGLGWSDETNKKPCAAGVFINERWNRAEPGIALRVPCFRDNRLPDLECALRRFPAIEEAIAEEQQRNERLKVWSDQIARGECPNGHGDSKPYRQVDNCVYGACGCRLYQGRLP